MVGAPLSKELRRPIERSVQLTPFFTTLRPRQDFEELIVVWRSFHEGEAGQQRKGGALNESHRSQCPTGTFCPGLRGLIEELIHLRVGDAGGFVKEGCQQAGFVVGCLPKCDGERMDVTVSLLPSFLDGFRDP